MSIDCNKILILYIKKRGGKSMKLKYSLLVALMLAFVLVLAACTGDGGRNGEASEEDDDPGTEEDAGTDDDDSGDDDTAEAAAEGDQVLIFARGGDSESLDAASTTDGESSRITRLVYEGLLEFDRDSFEILPALAHEWDVAEDGLSYTFYLEEGVTFHDGTEFNAEAVKINFERWSDPEHEFAFRDENYVYPRYVPIFGGEKGDEGHLIEEINVIDDYEIEFVLRRPDGIFLRNLTISSFNIMSPAALEEYGPDIDQHPVGTGPFKFVEWQKDESVTLEKFEDYREEGLPVVDKVIFEVIPENSARLIALRAGDIDIMDGVNVEDAESIEADDDLELIIRDENNFGYLGFNVEKEPFNDKSVRQAINYAIDREAIVEAMYGEYGRVATNPFPSSEIGYHEGIGYEFDLGKAREILEESGYADGLEIELWTLPIPRPYFPNPEAVSEIIQHDLAEIGIDVIIVNEEWATYLDSIDNGEQQMFMLGGTGINGDPSYGLNLQLREDSFGSGNNTFYHNPEVEKLLDEALEIIDEDERVEVYKEIQEIVAEDVPKIPLVHSRPLVAISKDVKNFVAHPTTSDKLLEVDIER